MTNKVSKINRVNHNENKKNDIHRPSGEGGKKEITPVFENFHGVPID